ncbi:MAG: substrate-binding domain-containing protein [Lachnospiraceae bacterium]
MRKKILATILAGAMCMGLAACGSSSTATSESTGTTSEATSEVASEAASEATSEVASEAATGETPKIAFVGKVEGQPWWENVKANVEEWGVETGVDVVYQAPAEVDAAAQVQIMTDLVNQGEIDVLCFSPNDPDACEAICKEAMDKGIIVIATEASGMTNVNYDVEAFDEAGLGAFLMDELAKQMGEEGEYVTMVGSLTMESQNNWADAGIARQEEAYPNMTYLDERVVDDSDADVAYNKTKELIQKYPELKGILGTGSFDAPGAARAIEEMGLTGQVFAISVAMPSETADYLKSGTLQSIGLWDAGATAQAMLNLSVKMFAGEEIGSTVDLTIDGYQDCAVNGTVVVGDGQIAITADNVDEWIALGL